MWSEYSGGLGSEQDVTRVLVTGGNGFIGHHLCRRLINYGHDVIVLVHHHRQRLPCSPSLVAVQGDVMAVESITAAIDKQGPVDVIAHLATEPPGPGLRLGINEIGTVNVLHAARVAGVRRVVFTSTMSVFDFLDPDLPIPVGEDHPVDPTGAYGVEKYTAEEHCRSIVEQDDGGADGGELEVVILRLAGVYGPGKRAGAVDNFLQASLHGDAIEIVTDRGVDLLWVEDAVTVVTRALGAGAAAGTMQVDSGHAVHLSQIARAAADTVCHKGQAAPSITVQSRGHSFCLDISRARRA